jgi:pathogenesis-related protein 1
MIFKPFFTLILFLSAVDFASAASNFTSAEQAELVTAHNKWRSNVNVSPLTWSNSLADTAQAYANTLKTTQSCNMVHSHTKDVGENLFWASPIMFSNGTSGLQPVTATQVVDSWGAENKDYNYQTNTCKKGQICGHYTQVVWRDTTQVGCGKAVCSDNSQVWVCQYSPTGNYVGKKPY